LALEKDLRRRGPALRFSAIETSSCDNADSSSFPRPGLAPNHDLDVLVERFMNLLTGTTAR
jgi:hypothetical protein